jgi:2-methylcitrate dehydratase
LNLAERLSEYADGLTYGGLGKVTVEETKKRIVDAVGCGLGAWDEEPVRIARKVAATTFSGGSSVIMGSSQKTTPDVATFVNGLMIRYFDYNDTYLSKEPAHPSDNIGATLSVARSVGASGRELILATALAYEIQCRLADSADIRHRGWDHVCYGLVSSALGAGKLLGLNRRKMTQAVNIALNAHIAMRQVRAGELSMWKGASFANAGRNAVFAALLAKDGMTGPSPIFEGEMGFFKQVSGPFDLEQEGFGRDGKGYKVCDTYIKYFPAEYHAQTAIWAAIEIRRQIGNPGDIESVEVATHEAGYTILGKDPEKWHPTTKETADHSMPYVVGMALLEGRVDNGTYSKRKVKDPRTAEFLSRIMVKEDPGLTSFYPARGMANRITVRTKGGATFSKEVVVPRGHPLDPMSDKEVEEKFRRLTRRKLAPRRAEKLLEVLWGLEKVKDAGSLMPLMRLS